MLRAALALGALAAGTVRALEPLCRAGVAAGEPAGCRVEGGSFLGGGQAPATPRTLVVAQYNVNYNGEGGEGDPHKQDGLDGIEAMLRTVAPDLVTLSEVERGCSARYSNGAEELARRLGMAWAYGVEFVQLGRGGGGNGTGAAAGSSSAAVECTTGNAVLSRYPLRSVSQLLFSAQCCAYPGRANGRSALSAVATLPGGLSVGVHSTHLESGSESEFLPAVLVRARQGRELARAALDMAASQGLAMTIIG
jgi:endonuclease/exonuclease/phosphatase family metal-dependent hydrolase